MITSTQRASRKPAQIEASKTSGTSPSTSIAPRGLRIEQAAHYSGLSPFYIEEQIRAGNLLSIGGPGSGVCAAHVVLREHLDKFLDDLAEAAEERRAAAKKAAA